MAAALVVLAGCHRVRAPVSSVRMGDPADAGQLISGFYSVENGEGENAWRWTGPKFSVALAPPAEVKRGARLRLKLYFPETQIKKLGPTTLTASVDGEEFASETYVQGGSYDFVRDVPACFLDTNVLPISFSVRPYVPKSEQDGRDLGAVVLRAALEPK